MQITGNTVLVTGGTSGIGLALAERFLAAGNEVVVCGRREALLADLKRRLPQIHTVVSDTGRAADREALFAEVTERFPALNVVINNAGIQRKVALTEGEPWAETASEIAINLEGPIHLAMLFAPHLAKQERPVIANVTSGLAFAPIAAMPVYCATKAALHSFTLSLRHQLAKSGVEVVEIIPPAVRTNLGGSHDFGTPLDEYADSVMAQLAEGRPETTHGFSAKGSQASRAELDEIFRTMNAR
ncbi:MAG: short-chain dehydrogenase/reductase [Labilithrix sp.]|nr:short-chain dehydrogenase/reductase [Labilithrix sp.]